MKNKSDISVLSLEFWMKYYVDTKRGREENNLKEIRPIFHRDGWYFNRRTRLEWYEYKGKAFVPRGSPSMFLYTLELLSAQVLSPREVNAYSELLKLAPKKFLKRSILYILEKDKEKKYLREIGQSSLRICREYREKSIT